MVSDYKGTTISLISELLDKRGNSSETERISLMNKLLTQLTEPSKQTNQMFASNKKTMMVACFFVGYSIEDKNDRVVDILPL